jgi:hypothetical protein
VNALAMSSWAILCTGVAGIFVLCATLAQESVSVTVLGVALFAFTSPMSASRKPHLPTFGLSHCLTGI